MSQKSKVYQALIIAEILLLLALLLNAGRSASYKYMTSLLSDDDVYAELVNNTGATAGFVSLPPDSAGEVEIHRYYRKGVLRRAVPALHSGDTSQLLLSFGHREHMFVLCRDSVFDVTDIFGNDPRGPVLVSQMRGGAKALPANAYHRSYSILVGDVVADVVWHGALLFLVVVVGVLLPAAKKSFSEESGMHWPYVTGVGLLLLALSAGLLLLDVSYIYRDIQALALIGDHI